jgi:hypothetical protein
VDLPSLANAVQIKVPVDAVDPVNVSSVNSPIEVLADWVEFLKQERLAMAGVDTWVSTKAYTEGSIAVDGNSHRMYRAILTSGNTNKRPSEESDYWVQCDWSRADIQAFSSKYTAGSGAAGITCTRGASVVTAHMVNSENTLRQIMLVIQTVPLNQSIEVDLSASDISFLSLFYGGVVSMRSGAWQFGGQVGLNPPATGHDVFVIWAKKDSSDPDPATTCTVSVMLWGV